MTGDEGLYLDFSDTVCQVIAAVEGIGGASRRRDCQSAGPPSSIKQVFQ